MKLNIVILENVLKMNGIDFILNVNYVLYFVSIFFLKI